ncbi:MAG: peptide ABC transporter substrate-binding protein [Ferruginibacter sp.]|nr:peptide ABC transporter substrate-binding protein [Rhodoferax sp.]
MNKLHRFGMAAAVFLMGAAALSQSASYPPKGTPLHAKQELVRSNGAEPETLDPANVETYASMNVVNELFEGLTAVDAGGNVVPGIALSWKQVNPTTWVFNLRNKTVFSNGEPLTAQDFVYSWQRFFDPKTASSYAGTFGMFLVNGTEIVEGKKLPGMLGVKALDAHTLEVKTPVPVPFMPSLVSNSQLVPVHRATVEKFGPNWTKPAHLVGNGPYLLRAASVNNKIVVQKNSRYWDSANVNLTQVTFLPIDNQNADLLLYRSGETDMTFLIPPGSYAGLRATYPQEIHNTPLLEISYFTLNRQDPLLKDVRVRKALSMVIDRDVLTQKITAEGQIPLYGLMVKGTSGADVSSYAWATWPMTQRVAEAKKLLAQANVKAGTKLKISYATSDLAKKTIIFISSEWKTKLGLAVEMENSEQRVHVKRLRDGDYQIGRYSWVVDYNDATSFLAVVQCGSAQNMTQGCSKEADALAEQGNQSSDQNLRKSLLSQSAALAMEDYPLIPMFQTTAARLVKAYVGGYGQGNVQDRTRSKDLYILKH